MKWIVYESGLVPSKIKGELPDVIYRYIANTSDINHHFDFTRERENAYIFEGEAYDLEEVTEIADLLNMQLRELN